MTTIEILIVILGIILGVFFVIPFLLYICTYMFVRGWIKAVKDSKTSEDSKTSYKHLFNLIKYGKES